MTDIGAQLHASDEFFQRSGNRDSGFVDALYRRLLHRAPDDGGRDYWLRELRAGTPRITITASFYASPESRLDRVDRTYRSVLLRTPDPGGSAYWADQLLRIDDVDLAEYLAASDEFFQRAQR